MMPAKITIQGDFWDCQIYRGRLYLWYSNGDVSVFDWGKLVRSFITDPAQDLALTCAFLDGRFLYASNLSVLFRDEQFKSLLETKFDDLTRRNLVIEENDLHNFLISKQSNPFNELQTDSEILYNTVYALTYDGIFCAAAHRPIKNKYQLSTKISKVTDLVGYSMKAGKYSKLAVSAGDDGLFEYNASSGDDYFDDFDERNRLHQVSSKHSSFADFNFLSLYNSSIIGSSFLSLHRWEEDETTVGKPRRTIEKEISDVEIFGDSLRTALSWGTNEKIYRARDNMLEVVTFNNYAKDEDYFSRKHQFQFQAWKGNILKGGVAYFGTIIECQNALVVLMGDDDFFNIQGAVTRWRVYPRSLNYENHLHVIHDNRIEIYSFNNDYFRDQKNKDIGLKFSETFSVNPKSRFRF